MAGAYFRRCSAAAKRSPPRRLFVFGLPPFDWRWRGRRGLRAGRQLAARSKRCDRRGLDLLLDRHRAAGQPLSPSSGPNMHRAVARLLGLLIEWGVKSRYQVAAPAVGFVLVARGMLQVRSDDVRTPPALADTIGAVAPLRRRALARCQRSARVEVVAAISRMRQRPRWAYGTPVKYANDVRCEEPVCAQWT